MLKLISALFFLFIINVSCGIHKNIVQTTHTSIKDTLLKNINSSTADTEIKNPQLKKLQEDNDLTIAFASLNYAWTRKGTYYILACKNNSWKFYSYQSKLPPSSDAKTEVASLNVSDSSAQTIKKLYESSALWKTNGDEGDFCNGKNDCNITDAETWTLSVATPQNIHTTTYYAPEFFENCCPGNVDRRQFIAIVKEMMKVGKFQNPLPER